MKPYYWSLIGLTLDILGGFLVAVEAIKLRNLRVLRDRVFRSILMSMESPRVVFNDTSEDEAQGIRDYNRSLPLGSPLLYWGSHLIAGYVAIVVIYGLLRYFHSDLLGWVPNSLGEMWLPLRVLVTVLGIGLLTAVLIIPALAVGEIVHQLLRLVSRLPIAILDIIDRKTPDGTIGIVGFASLFCGFLLQMVGTWYGAHATSPR